jgi:hypothetical protein
VFYTIAVEPFELRAATREGARRYTKLSTLPKGTWAGTPSSRLYGPQRMIVRLRDLRDEVQEYEEREGAWVPVGDLHMLRGDQAANLSLDGLTMVYAGYGPDGAPGVFAAQRRDTSEWFREPHVQLLAGRHRGPQLSPACTTLETITDGQVTTYTR